MRIDGLEINNWSRQTVEQIKSGGIDVVHATCGVWEDPAGALTRIGDWRHFARENADMVRIVKSVEEMHSAKNEGILGVCWVFKIVPCLVMTLKWQVSLLTLGYE